MLSIEQQMKWEELHAQRGKDSSRVVLVQEPVRESHVEDSGSRAARRRKAAMDRQAAKRNQRLSREC